MPTEPFRLLTCGEAMTVVRSHGEALAPPTTRLAVEHLPLDDALGRVLARDLHADRPQPPFPRSTRDGYAVRSADLRSEPFAPLRLIGAIRAGEQWSGPPLRAGEAIEIMTGAPVPAGADCVLMLEHAGGDTHAVTPRRTLLPGENVVPEGAEAHQGEVVLTAGTRVGPAEVALAASIGAARLPVFQRPVVAILSTGDELVSVDATPLPQQIRNSNAHAIAALVRANGGEPLILPAAADTRVSIDRSLDAARDAGMLLLSGGVSAGRYDLVEPVLAARGARFFFTGVAMQPGKPVVFGVLPALPAHSPAKLAGVAPNATASQATSPQVALGTAAAEVLRGAADGSQCEASVPQLTAEAPQLTADAPQVAANAPASDAAAMQWIFGLPGNPVSTQVTATLFAMPLLRALGGETAPEPAFAAATLSAPLTTRPGFTRFLPARLDASLTGSSVAPTGWQGSGDLHGNSTGNCYLVVPPGVDHLPAGSTVQVLLR